MERRETKMMNVKYQGHQEMHVDKNEKRIIVPGKVNGLYFENPARHLIVADEGNEEGKTLFRTDVTPTEFYNALLEIGAEPGDNMVYETAQEQHVEGQPLDIHVVWEGSDQVYSVDDLIEDSKGNSTDFRFAGNIETSKEKGTGCLVCLDSCYISPVSNHTYTFGAIKKRDEVSFPANKGIVPEDGTPVDIIISMK